MTERQHHQRVVVTDAPTIASFDPRDAWKERHEALRAAKAKECERECELGYDQQGRAVTTSAHALPELLSASGPTGYNPTRDAFLVGHDANGDPVWKENLT